MYIKEWKKREISNNEIIDLIAGIKEVSARDEILERIDKLDTDKIIPIFCDKIIEIIEKNRWFLESTYIDSPLVVQPGTILFIENRVEVVLMSNESSYAFCTLWITGEKQSDTNINYYDFYDEKLEEAVILLGYKIKNQFTCNDMKELEEKYLNPQSNFYIYSKNNI